MHFLKLGRSLSFVLAGLALCSTAEQASAASSATSRMGDRIGFGLAILGDPVPSLISYQLKFNALKWLQIVASYGSISASGTSVDPTTGVVTTGGGSVKGFGLSAKAFLIPSWGLSPYLGAGYSLTKIDGDFTISGETIDSSKSSLHGIVASGGLDYQAGIGFNIGAGVHYVIAPTELKDALPIIPYFYFGWFF